MNDLEGPALAAAVARLRGIGIDPPNETFSPEVVWRKHSLHGSVMPYAPHEPGADAWELHRHIREKGRDIHYRDECECWIDTQDISGGRTVGYGEGATDAEALCRAFVAMMEGKD